jgi:hypothetical protein
VYALQSENCAAIERKLQIKTFNFSFDLQDVTDESKCFFSNDVTLQLFWRANPNTTMTCSSEEPRVMRQHETD